MYEVRIAGPDDVIHFDTEIEAHRHANTINKLYLINRAAHPEQDVFFIATVNDQTIPVDALHRKTFGECK